LEFFLIEKPFTIDVYFKGKNVQNWNDVYFKRKICKIGRLMFNPLVIQLSGATPFPKSPTSL
jgi:hypothetical protein